MHRKQNNTSPIDWRIILLSFLLVLVHTVLFGQSKEKKSASLTGSVSAEQIYSHYTNEILQADQPYQLFLRANATAKMGDDFYIPFSLTYTNKTFNNKASYNQQTFNRFGMSPRYKWVTVHAGWRSMTYSKYSLNGRSYFGAGLELKPGNFQIRTMYGRLLKPVEQDTNFYTANIPAYERWGSGFQLKYAKDKNAYAISLFRANDVFESLNMPLDNLNIYPEENFVYAVTIDQTIKNKITFSGEYAMSYIIADSRYNTGEGSFVTDNVYINENDSKERYNAANINTSYLFGKAELGLGYERVDPGYKTHGSYFFSNDFENITAKFAAPLFKNKFLFNTSIGVERDNLSNKNANTSNRLIALVHATWSPTKKATLSGMYSNFRNITEFNPNAGLIETGNPFDRIDSVRYLQVNENASLNAMFRFGTKAKPQTFSSSVGYMNSISEYGIVIQETQSSFYNGNLLYTCSFTESAFEFGTGVNALWNETEIDSYGTVGPSASLTKMFFDKSLRSTINYAYNAKVSDESNLGNVQSFSLNNSVSIRKKHKITLIAIWIQRPHYLTETATYELTDSFLARLKYAYTF